MDSLASDEQEAVPGDGGTAGDLDPRTLAGAEQAARGAPRLYHPDFLRSLRILPYLAKLNEHPPVLNDLKALATALAHTAPAAGRRQFDQLDVDARDALEAFAAKWRLPTRWPVSFFLEGSLGAHAVWAGIARVAWGVAPDHRMIRLEDPSVPGGWVPDAAEIRIAVPSLPPFIFDATDQPLAWLRSVACQAHPADRALILDQGRAAAAAAHGAGWRPIPPRLRGASGTDELHRGARRLFEYAVLNLSLVEISINDDPEGPNDPPTLRAVRAGIRDWAADLGIPRRPPHRPRKLPPLR